MEPLRPVVILVEPQLGDNIGATARAMLNCGLTELRLVSPRDGWPNPQAHSMASGADRVLEEARLFERVEDAIADLQRVYATTARHRDMVKHVVTPRRAAEEIRSAEGRGERCGFLFGRERIGLTNDEVVLADALLNVPLNPEFSSLNLAQAVLLVVWEWYQAGDATAPRQLVEAGHATATREELLNFYDHLEAALDARGFFRVAAKRPSTVRTLRNIFQRSELTDRDVRILHGVLTALMRPPRDEA
jgi:tRNA/rRNA methyltransferase